MGRGSSQRESKFSGGREKVFNSQSIMFQRKKWWCDWGEKIGTGQTFYDKAGDFCGAGASER